MTQIADYLFRLWDAAHMSFQTVRTNAGLTQAGMAMRFCMPRRTVENWCSGDRPVPDYVRLMMMEALGLVSREITP